MRLGLSLSLSTALSTGGGGVVYPTMLPALPAINYTAPYTGNPDADRAAVQNAIDTQAVAGVEYVIGIPTYVNWGHKYLPPAYWAGTPGYSAGDDQRLFTNGKTLTFVPVGGYGQMYIDPEIGDGQYYDHTFTRTATIHGHIHKTGAGTLKVYGIFFEYYGLLPAYGQTWRDVNMMARKPHISVDSSATGDVHIFGCAAAFGKDGTGTPFQVDEVLTDYTSPPSWYMVAGNNEGNIILAAAPTSCTFTGSISGTVLTVTSVPTAPIYKAMTLAGTGVTACSVSRYLNVAADGTGTYEVSVSQTAASTTITATPTAAQTTVISATGTGTWDGGKLNRYFNMPVLFNTLNAQGYSGTGWDGNFYFAYNHVRDMTAAFNTMTSTAGGWTYDQMVYRNRIDRIYMDEMLFAYRQQSRRYCDVYGNFTTGTFAKSSDRLNPHRDRDQDFISSATLDNQKSVGKRRWANLSYDRNNARATSQGAFQGPPAYHNANGTRTGYALGARFYGDVMIGQTGKAIDFDAEAATYINRSVCFNPGAAADAGNGTASIRLQVGSTNKAYRGPYSKGILKNSVYESLLGDVPHQNDTTDSVAVGAYSAGRNSTTMQTVLANPGLLASGPASYNDAFLLSKTSNAAIGNPYATLKDMFSANWPSSVLDFAVPDVYEAAIGGTITSDIGILIGNRGTTYNVTPVSLGLSVQVQNQYTDAVINAYTTSPIASVDDGRAILLRQTAPATGSTLQTNTLTIGGQPFSWRIQTASAITPPTATQTAGGQLKRVTSGGANANGLVGVNDTTKFSVVLRFKTPASFAGAAQTLAIIATGTPFNLTIQTNGQITTSGRDGSSNFIFSQVPATIMTTSTDYTILGSVDITNGVSVWYFNGQRATMSSNVLTAAFGNIRFGSAAGQWNFMSNSTNTSPMRGDLAYFALIPDTYIDWDDPLMRLRATPDYVGPTGEGLTGTTPPVFLEGTAATLNALYGANLGTGGNIDNVAADYTQTVAGAWPPNLYLRAEQISSTSVRVSVIGWPKSGVSITATSNVNGAATPQTLPVARDGYVDFTFPAGAQTITITNSGGYNNPAPLAMV